MSVTLEEKVNQTETEFVTHPYEEEENITIRCPEKYRIVYRSIDNSLNHGRYVFVDDIPQSSESIAKNLFFETINELSPRFLVVMTEPKNGLITALQLGQKK